jgi:DNA invertase Pin-like site-specific DNA recombinase
MSRTFGYARVSTDEQDIALQEDALNKYGVDHIFWEKMTGARMDRPQLARCIKVCRKGDKIVIWKLDRLGRSTVGLIEAVEALDAKGIQLVSIVDHIDTTTAMGKFFFTIMAAIAQLERDMISERTRAGVAAYQARGGKMGKPHFVRDCPNRLARFNALWPIIYAGGMTGKQVIAEMNEVPSKLDKVKTPQSFYNWRAKGYEGFYPAEPIEETDTQEGQSDG